MPGPLDVDGTGVLALGEGGEAEVLGGGIEGETGAFGDAQTCGIAVRFGRDSGIGIDPAVGGDEADDVAGGGEGRAGAGQDEAEDGATDNPP